MATAKDQSGVLPGTGKASSWRDGAFTAKDARTLIWRVSRAGHDKQHMNMDRAFINQGGIHIKGRKCGKDDKWLTFSETAKNHAIGGKLCDGKKSFVRKPGLKARRYSTLLGYISDMMFASTHLEHKNIGWPHLIKSDGREALFIYGSPSGELAKGAIRTIRFVGKKMTIVRF
jgi:hypothetical protein